MRVCVRERDHWGGGVDGRACEGPQQEAARRMHLYFERNASAKCDCNILSLSWMGKLPDELQEVSLVHVESKARWVSYGGVLRESFFFGTVDEGCMARSAGELLPRNVR